MRLNNIKTNLFLLLSMFVFSFLLLIFYSCTFDYCSGSLPEEKAKYNIENIISIEKNLKSYYKRITVVDDKLFLFYVDEYQNFNIDEYDKHTLTFIESKDYGNLTRTFVKNDDTYYTLLYESAGENYTYKVEQTLDIENPPYTSTNIGGSIQFDGVVEWYDPSDIDFESSVNSVVISSNLWNDPGDDIIDDLSFSMNGVQSVDSNKTGFNLYSNKVYYNGQAPCMGWQNYLSIIHYFGKIF